MVKLDEMNEKIFKKAYVAMAAPPSWILGVQNRQISKSILSYSFQLNYLWLCIYALRLSVPTQWTSGPFHGPGDRRAGPGGRGDQKSIRPAQPVYLPARYHRIACVAKQYGVWKAPVVADAVVKKKQSRLRRRYWVHKIFKERPIFGEYHHLIQG